MEDSLVSGARCKVTCINEAAGSEALHDNYAM